MTVEVKPLPPVNLPELKIIGKPLRRVDALGKAVGATVYAGDFAMPGMLHAKVFRSTEPSARIVRLDVSKARALPGVACVLTSGDLPNARLVTDMPGQTGQAQRKGSDAPVLAIDSVRFVGEPIALIAAETEAIAEAALRLVEIEYEATPGIFDPEDGLKPGAPVLHEGALPGEHNKVGKWKIRKGDLERGFADADLVVENTFRVPYQDHAYIEPEAGVGWLDSQGVINLRVSTQVIEHFRSVAEGARGAAEQDPRAGHHGRRRVRRQGRHHRRDLPGPARSGNGAARAPGLHPRGIDPRALQAPPLWSSPIARASAATARSRRVRSRHRPIRARTPTSAPTCCSTPPSWRRAPTVDNLHVDAVAVATNNPFTSAFRGFGGPQACFAYEQQMDAIAAALGIDRWRSAASTTCTPATRRRPGSPSSRRLAGRDGHACAAGCTNAKTRTIRALASRVKSRSGRASHRTSRATAHHLAARYDPGLGGRGTRWHGAWCALACPTWAPGRSTACARSRPRCWACRWSRVDRLRHRLGADAALGHVDGHAASSTCRATPRSRRRMRCARCWSPGHRSCLKRNRADDLGNDMADVKGAGGKPTIRRKCVPLATWRNAAPPKGYPSRTWRCSRRPFTDPIDPETGPGPRLPRLHLRRYWRARWRSTRRRAR